MFGDPYGKQLSACVRWLLWGLFLAGITHHRATAPAGCYLLACIPACIAYTHVWGCVIRLHHPRLQSHTMPASPVPASAASSPQPGESVAWVRVLLLCLSRGMALPLSSSRSPPQHFAEAGGAGGQGERAPGETLGC